MTRSDVVVRHFIRTLQQRSLLQLLLRGGEKDWRLHPPGLWHTHDDLERIRNGILQKQQPWYKVWQNFSLDPFSQSDVRPRAVLSRGAISNYSSFTSDTRAAYQNALMWSTTILDAWGTTLTDIVGTDTSLLIRLEGTMFANAAEIMRWEGNWTEAEAEWYGGSGFSNQLYWLFARQFIIIGQANYGMVSIKALLDFAAYLDDVTMYNYALNAFQKDICAGYLAAEAVRTVQSQGGDLYSIGNNLLFLASKYAAKYTLNYTVPFDRKFYRCEAVLINGPWSEPSPINRVILYYQYAVRRGLAAPWTTKSQNGL
ncbi:hypothetical protein OIDMADRAFT_43399 [Oidiodendron maius Zn]|uniref:Alginate lyase domain-containing protein n=1 Tax=Oidiodendron maius (strain Zn) TaxID=913774 RepID=A0A0C3H7K1_OIDMZ|nr:hypothetical protein OIDMADRAFT_43399 [Oidiodendron maius Zn]